MYNNTNTLLDILFQNRNKAYGAYELRINYQRRITKALLVTGIFAAAVILSMRLANSQQKKDDTFLHGPVIEILPPPEETKTKPITPLKKEKPVEVQQEKLTTLVPVPDEKVASTPPTQDDLALAKIGEFKQEGVPDNRLPTEISSGEQTGVILAKQEDEEAKIWRKVEIDANYDGDWVRFLERTLNPNTPSDNGAAPGRYTVLIQFVVDLEGNLSQITPLTAMGYGMEQEAIRVIKKSKKWRPAFQNSRNVVAYRKQQITFIVE